MKIHMIILPFYMLIATTPLLLSEEIETKENSVKKVDEQEQILLYGIKDDILNLLDNLKREKISTYNLLLVDLYKETKDPAIQQKIFGVWEITSFEDGLLLARQEIDHVIQDYDFNNNTVKSALSYLAVMKDSQVSGLLLELANYHDQSIASAAVRTLGGIGIEDENISPEPLLELLNNPENSQEFKLALIKTLGELRYTEAADNLVAIVEDNNELQANRHYASLSLGKIGRPEDSEVLKRVYNESSDALMRSFALSGLSEFKDFETTDIMVQALKRDPFWRIRVVAAQKLIGNNDNAVQNLLMYKAANDPVAQVRLESIKALGTSAMDKSHTFLIDYLVDEKYDTKSRLEALNTLIENRIPGTKKAIGELMDKLWEKKNDRFLEFVCRDLSFADWAELGPLYSRMLDHPNWLMIIYGIRGIRRNNLTTFQARINQLDDDGIDARIRREINK